MKDGLFKIYMNDGRILYKIGNEVELKGDIIFIDTLFVPIKMISYIERVKDNYDERNT